ncbi:hypothetical protein LEP1GSC188_2509 [Leptospira weilii serovar Topaz str. LT2116]|uniref:Uncharacterized protein n=1 Tax=Leptospira weilii serovar Topaz str. LT2116 TaxID=1088540 RepID=M3GTE5_9LEPT|nr:hypothetical protein LEP1GSC188_2509 [Leptospira weilii serovar Topaz str. LT2116]
MSWNVILLGTIFKMGILGGIEKRKRITAWTYEKNTIISLFQNLEC